MTRRVRGVLAVEGVQTGDGRLIVDGALTWADLPLPLAWLREEQHGDLLGGAVQIGTIDEIGRSGSDVTFVGTIDDGQEDGAEFIRRLEAGTAPQGARWGVSIDPDDYEVQIVATESDDDEGGLLLVASARGFRGTWAELARVLRAAAGDPDPGADGGDEGMVLFEDSVDSILQRYTRLRIRGATACAIPAFDGAYLELDGAAAEETPAAEPVVAATAPPVRPPAAWFSEAEPEIGDERLIEQAGGTVGVPLTITDEGQVYGHAAVWGTCHVGFPQCVEPPRSARSYVDFHTGEVLCADDQRIAVGTLTASCDHAAIRLRAREAQDHYAHSGVAWADVRVTDGTFGVWVSGALRPDVTDEQLRVLRACGLSGDWRRIGSGLELVGLLAVNVPGFRIRREQLVASGLDAMIEQTPVVIDLDGEAAQALVASGFVQRCVDCARRRTMRSGTAQDMSEIVELLSDVVKRMRVIDARTRHLVPTAMQHAYQRLTPATNGDRVDA